MSDTTTHSQDPHDPAILRRKVLQTIYPSLAWGSYGGKKLNRTGRHEQELRRRIARDVTRVLDAPKLTFNAPKPVGDTFLVSDMFGTVARNPLDIPTSLTRDDVKAIVREALANFDPFTADVDSVLRDRGVEVKPGESPYLALLRSIPVNAESGGKRADEWRRKSAVANHLMGVSFSPDQATRNAALHLVEALPILDLELTDRAKDPSQCSVDDLGVRLASTDHVVQALDRVTSDDSPVRQVVRNLLHNSSPSVVDAGAHSVGDGPGAGDASATPATEATLELLVAAVRDANVDIKSLRRVDAAALANYNKSGRNLAKAIKDRADAERALLDYLTGDQA